MMSAFCMLCLAQKELNKLDPALPESVKASYIRDVMKIIGESDPEDATPVVLHRIDQKHVEYFGAPFDYEPIKRAFNELMLQEVPELQKLIREAEDPVAMAMKLARVGNYIDFGTIDNVDPVKLRELLKRAETDVLDPQEYLHLTEEMETASSLVYLTDNCGEVVLDKLLVEAINNRWPEVKVTVIVRGAPVLNDATLEDAAMIGLSEAAEVLDNGNDIAGTWIPRMSELSKERLLNADVIISKGQANFESLNGCGLNVYYLFLCKCDWFVKRFQMEKLKGVLANDRRLALKA